VRNPDENDFFDLPLPRRRLCVRHLRYPRAAHA
jgi:hypothetical protein